MAYNNVKVKERQTVKQSSQTQQLGIVSEVPMNEWNAEISYEKLNLVTYKNSTFIAKRANKGTPPLDTPDWQDVWMMLKSGVGVSSAAVEYVLGDISSSVPPQDGWSTEIPAFEAGKLLWTRITIAYTDGARSVVYSVGVPVAPTKTSELVNDGNGTSPFATENNLQTTKEEIGKTTTQLSEALTKETARAKAAEQTNAGDIATNAQAIATEKTRAEGAESGLDARVKTIESEIPAQASADNQLADKAFVNSSINALAAFYITSDAAGDAYASKAALTGAATFYSGGKPRVPTQNDYAIVLADESQAKGADGSYPTTRYSYQGGTYPNGQWAFQYIVNNTSLTAAQVAALNSGITSAGVAQITTNKNDITTETARAKAAEKVNANAAAVAQSTADGKYTKPSGGIPKSDLASAVQTSLGRADTAVQPSALNDYVTTNTEQRISAKKQFNGGIDVYGGGIGVDDDADSGAVYHANGILFCEGGIPKNRMGDEGVDSWFLSFPQEDGILLVNTDLTWSNISDKPSWIGASKPSYSYSEISGTPSSLKNPSALSITVDGTTTSYDGSSAKSITIKTGSSSKLDAWPIGSIYITWYGDSAHAPGAVLGGSWTQLPQNYCLWTATGTLTDSDSGHELGAMLPNIKGEWQRGKTSENTIYTGSNYTAPSGAFVTVGSSRSAKVMASSSSSYTGYQKLGFDASKSNSVYQEGSTVRPPAYRIFAYRRYA